MAFAMSFAGTELGMVRAFNSRGSYYALHEFRFLSGERGRDAMRGKHSPRGLWLVAALALLGGVGLLSPTPVWAEDTGSDDDSGIFSPPRGGTPEPGGGEADPDWWQTDVWDQAEIVALPAADSPREPETRRVLQVVENPILAFVQWLSRLSGHHLGF
jgi:hypothetical protein